VINSCVIISHFESVVFILLFFHEEFFNTKYQVTSVLPSTLKLKVAFPATDPTFEVYIDRIDEKSVICVI